MRLSYEEEPIAGQAFTCHLLDIDGEAQLTYYVGNRPYGDERCEAPVCALRFAVPTGTAGEFLRLVVEDNAGPDEFRVRIQENEAVEP